MQKDLVVKKTNTIQPNWVNIKTKAIRMVMEPEFLSDADPAWNWSS